MNKFGDINWSVVTIVISILTLVVLVLIVYVFPWEDTVDRTACKSSIVLRATIPDSTSAKDLISLRCKTRKICITDKSSGKGNCSDILGEDFDTMKLTGDTQLQKMEQIKMFISREMADCWEMFGEGKLQIFSREWVWDGAATTKAITCSRIAFDDSVINGVDKKPNTVDDLKNITGLGNYMLIKKAPNNNISYMDYLRGSPEGQSASEFYGSQKSNGALFGNVNLSRQTAIIFIETTKTNIGKLWGGSIVGVVGSVAGGWIGSYAGGTFTGVKIGGAAGMLLGGTFGDTVQNLFSDIPAGRNSVSGLFLVDYSYEGIKDYDIKSFEGI